MTKKCRTGRMRAFDCLQLDRPPKQINEFKKVATLIIQYITYIFKKSFKNELQSKDLKSSPDCWSSDQRKEFAPKK